MIVQLQDGKTNTIAAAIKNPAISICAYACVCFCSLLLSSHIIFIFQSVPVKATFVEYTVQECPEGVTERGTCQRLTLDSDTEVLV